MIKRKEKPKKLTEAERIKKRLQSAEIRMSYIVSKQVQEEEIYKREHAPKDALDTSIDDGLNLPF